MSVPFALLQDCATFADVLAKLHAEKMTGSIVIHFAQGHAVQVELPREPERKRLDTGNKKRKLDTSL